MSFPVEWNECYRANTHMSVWPWTDLVSAVMRFARPSGPDFRVLELGCGAGANIPFFNKLNVQYFGIDGSPFIVNKLYDFFPELSDRIVVADFAREIPFNVEFDLIVDRAALTCNSTASIRNSLNLIRNKLKEGGKYIGIDWYSRDYSFYSNRKDIDSHTHIFYEGPFMETGQVHFSDKAHLLELFKDFEILYLVHKVHKQALPNENFLAASWDIVVQKRTLK